MSRTRLDDVKSGRDSGREGLEECALRVTTQIQGQALVLTNVHLDAGGIDRREQEILAQDMLGNRVAFITERLQKFGISTPRPHVNHVLNDEPAWFHCARISNYLKRSVLAGFHSWAFSARATVIRAFRRCKKEIDWPYFFGNRLWFMLFNSALEQAGLGKIVSKNLRRQRPLINVGQRADR